MDKIAEVLKKYSNNITINGGDYAGTALDYTNLSIGMFTNGKENYTIISISVEKDKCILQITNFGTLTLPYSGCAAEFLRTKLVELKALSLDEITIKDIIE